MPRAPKKLPEVKEPQKQTRQVAYWISEISAAKKREKTFRKDGDRILEIYEGKKSATTPFNILFSNTETMLPALYSAIPRPVVDRRFKDEDPVGKNAAEAGKRMLEFLIDTNVEGYETFDEAMRAATLDALLPGRGVTCEKYDAEVDNLPTESVDDAVPAAEDVENKQEDAGGEESAYKKWELVCSDSRSWNRVYFGYAKKWSKVPWVAFEEDIDKVEATRLFGERIAGQLSYSDTDDDEDKKADRDETDEGERKTARIYQVWDKSGGRKIRYIADQYKDDYLKVEDDPLQLTGFFNIPRPLTFLEKSNDLLPVAMYILYENQAKELNRIQVRINRIVDAIKARGIYDSELGDDIADLMKADDNALVPADKSSSLAAEKGLQNAIWFMPLDQLVATLQQLYQARESCKQVIYEITGIADIMRGSSNASETLGAQEIKQSWGTLRLKRLQKEVQRYARDLLRIKLEIAATKFSEETWARMTGLPFLTEAKFAELQAVSRALQQQIAAAPPMQPPMPADPNQPAAPPPPDPTQQQLAQVQQQLQTPQWSQILDVLRDDMQRAYRIDIETNSTVDPDATEDQKNIADLMTAFGQAMNSLGPLVAQGVLPFDMAKSMLLIIIRRYRFGSELEDYINQMQPPKPPPDASQGDAQKLAAEMDARKHEAQINASTEAAKLQDGKERKQAEMQAEAAKLQMEDATKRFLAGEETKREQMRLEAERREKQADRQAQRVLEEMKLNKVQETDLRKAALVAATAIETTTITATKSAETATAANEAAGSQAASTADLMAKILERQDKLLATLAAPKTVERDPKTGKALRLVTEMAGG